MLHLLRRPACFSESPLSGNWWALLHRVTTQPAFSRDGRRDACDEADGPLPRRCDALLPLSHPSAVPPLSELWSRPGRSPRDYWLPPPRRYIAVMPLPLTLGLLSSKFRCNCSHFVGQANGKISVADNTKYLPLHWRWLGFDSEQLVSDAVFPQKCSFESFYFWFRFPNAGTWLWFVLFVLEIRMEKSYGRFYVIWVFKSSISLGGKFGETQNVIERSSVQVFGRTAANNI